MIVPYLVLSTVSFLPVLLVSDPGAARGYYFWALLNGAAYLAVSIAIVALHIAESRAHSDLRSMLRFAGPRSAAISIVGAGLLFAAVLHGGAGLSGMTWPGHPAVAAQHVAAQHAAAPWPAAAPRGATVDVGVTTAPLANNGSRPWTAGDLSTVNSFERGIHKHAAVVMWYADWQHSAPSLTQLGLIQRRGSIPEITWEPWDSTKGLRAPQTRYALSNIVAGKFDAYIRSWARSLAAFGGPVRCASRRR